MFERLASKLASSYRERNGAGTLSAITKKVVGPYFLGSSVPSSSHLLEKIEKLGEIVGKSAYCVLHILYRTLLIGCSSC